MLVLAQLTSLAARSPTGSSSRQPGSGAPSAPIPAPPLRSPGPSCRWPGCRSGRSSAGPGGSEAARAGPEADRKQARSYLYDPNVSGDFGQRGVEVVGGQGLPPQGLVFIGPDPATQQDRVMGGDVDPEQPCCRCRLTTWSGGWSRSRHRSRTGCRVLRCSGRPRTAAPSKTGSFQSAVPAGVE